MPSIDDIAGAVAGVGARHIAVEQARCVRVRHRRSTCDRCLEACPEDALSIAGNVISLQAELCIGCGACANVCPTQALSTVQPSAEDLLPLVDELAPQEGSAARSAAGVGNPAEGDARELEFACPHALPSSIGNRIVVPALPFVDEGVLAHAAAVGFRRIVLTSCPRRECLMPALAVVPDAVASARELLSTWCIACDISFRRQKSDAAGKSARKAPALGRAASSLPHAASPAGGGQNDWGPSRRNALVNAVSQAGTIIAETASAELRERMGMRETPQTLSQVLTDGAGNLKKFPMPRMEHLVDDLFSLNPEPTGELRARGFVRVEVNGAACTRCGICMRFCPTGALDGVAVPIGGGAFMGSSKPASERGGSLSFRTSDCVGCRLCEDVCPLKCLHVKSQVDAESVFQLEPTDLLA